MKKVAKNHKFNQFSNQLLSQKTAKKVKGGDDIIIVDTIMEYLD